MRSIKKILLFLSVIILSFLLTACTSGGNEYEQLAKKAWNSISPSGDPNEIHYIKYKNINALSKDEIPDIIEYSIPQSGICIVIPGSNTYSYKGLHIVIFDSEGKYLQFTCSYDEYYRKYTDIIGVSTDVMLKKAKYLSVCNYLSDIYNNALKEKILSDEQTQNDKVETDTWYWLKDEQIKRIIGK